MQANWLASRGTRLRPVSASIYGWILLGLLVQTFFAAPGLVAQITNAPGQANEVIQTEEQTPTDATQPADTVREDDTTETNAVGETNQIISKGPDARERRNNRLRRPRPPGSALAASEASGTNAARSGSSLDYDAFHIIAERNIFDPNRSPRSNNGPVRPRTVDSFTFVGTMSYEKGIFAFFDGSTSAYKKVLKPQDSIAGYKVVAITPDTVKLMLNTNISELKVRSQMRKREDGSWELSAEPTSYENASTSTPQTTPAATGAESDIIKKMMQRREKE